MQDPTNRTQYTSFVRVNVKQMRHGRVGYRIKYNAMQSDRSARDIHHHTLQVVSKPSRMGILIRMLMRVIRRAIRRVIRRAIRRAIQRVIRRAIRRALSNCGGAF